MNAEKLIWSTFETSRAVARFAVVPATFDEPGHVRVQVAERGNDSYLEVSLYRRDLSNVCHVLRGMEEFAKIGDSVTFRHVIEPLPGYRLAFNCDGREIGAITFDTCDALALCIAFENVFSKVIFGI